MNKKRSYLLYLILGLALSACGRYKNKKITLWRNDKIAYGTYYAFHNLHYLFDDAEITTNRLSPLSFYRNSDTAAAYIIIGNNVKPSENELNALLNYAAAGNHIFISAISLGENLLDSFRLATTSYRHFAYSEDSLTVNLFNVADDDSSLFSYPGFGMDEVFTKMDTSITNILGTDARGHANFVKFTYNNGGSIALHLAPLGLTNFFLLHKENKEYFDRVISSSVPASVDRIRWDDYFRSHIDGSDTSNASLFSKLAAFLNHPVLRWAFWLAMLLFLIIYLFESKRKQRPVPVIKELRNSSLDFVETIGRLYYQRHDNKNLAAKMAAHFLSHVRNKYNISTSVIDEMFEQKLSFRTGYALEELKEIIVFIKSVEEPGTMSDDDLLTFSNKIDKFYKQT